MSESWPDHSQELARKSTETLWAAVLANDEGTMSDAELRLVCKTIIDVGQGLMPNEITELVIEVRRRLDNA